MKKIFILIKDLFYDVRNDFIFKNFLAIIAIFYIATEFRKLDLEMDVSSVITENTSRLYLITISFIIVIYSVIKNAFTYLNNDSIIGYNLNDEDERKRNIELIKKINYEIDLEDDLNKPELFDKIKDEILLEIKSNYADKIMEDSISNEIFAELSNLKRNTFKYIDRIQRNSIFNLVIGMIGTMISISILTYGLFIDKKVLEISLFLLYFLPKITVSIFIQLFSFFFLRLYKNNLEDIKYFQNELANISAKTSSIKLAYLLDEKILMSELVKELFATERNFKILKEETLLNIEKAKIEKEVDLESLNALKDILKTHKKDS